MIWQFLGALGIIALQAVWIGCMAIVGYGVLLVSGDPQVSGLLGIIGGTVLFGYSAVYIHDEMVRRGHFF